MNKQYIVRYQCAFQREENKWSLLGSVVRFSNQEEAEKAARDLVARRAKWSDPALHVVKWEICRREVTPWELVESGVEE